MKVKVGPYEFDRHLYNAELDILTVGETGEGEDTDDGHVVHYEFGSDEIIGFEFMDAKAAREAEGSLGLTLPDGRRFDIPDEAATRVLAAGVHSPDVP